MRDDGTTPEPGTGRTLRPTAPLGWAVCALLLIALVVLLAGCTESRVEGTTASAEQQHTQTTERLTGTVIPGAPGTSPAAGDPLAAGLVPGSPGPVTVDLTRTVETRTLTDRETTEQRHERSGLDPEAVQRAVAAGTSAALGAALPGLTAALRPAATPEAPTGWLDGLLAPAGGLAGAAGMAAALWQGRRAGRLRQAVGQVASLADRFAAAETDAEVDQLKREASAEQRRLGLHGEIQRARGYA